MVQVVRAVLCLFDKSMARRPSKWDRASGSVTGGRSSWVGKTAAPTQSLSQRKGSGRGHTIVCVCVCVSYCYYWWLHLNLQLASARGFIKSQTQRTCTQRSRCLLLGHVGNVVTAMDSPTPPIVIDDSNGSAMDACFTAFDKDGCVWNKQTTESKIKWKKITRI